MRLYLLAHLLVLFYQATAKDDLSFSIRLAVSDHFAVLAQNEHSRFIFMKSPYDERSSKCTIAYLATADANDGDYINSIHGIASGYLQDTNHLVFTVVGRSALKEYEYFAVIIVEMNNHSNCPHSIRSIRTRSIVDGLIAIEQPLVDLDPLNTHAYAFGYLGILSIDIAASLALPPKTKPVLEEYHFDENFFPKAFKIISKRRLFVAGIRKNSSNLQAYLYTVQLEKPPKVTILAEKEISPFNFGPNSINLNHYSSMSLSVHLNEQLILIGVPHLNLVTLVNATNSSELVLEFEHQWEEPRTFCGHSVTWIDHDKYAVLCLSLSTLPWSASQVLIYSYKHWPFSKSPLYTFPNNQQTIDPIAMSPIPPYAIHSIAAWTSGFGLVLDIDVVLLIPSSTPGSSSRRMMGNSSILVYTSDSCIVGTAQQENSSGPCLLCPPNTLNNGSFNFECAPCIVSDDTTEYCFRGGLAKLPTVNLTSYDQATPYPESAASTEFDDVLLQNLFRLDGTSAHCLLQSPVIWLVIIILISCMSCCIIGLLTRRSKYPMCNALMKKLCVRLDLIGEGRFWIGGFASLPILILLIFAIRFDHLFADQYPIESVTTDKSCYPSRVNAKFVSSLQLLSIHRHSDEEVLFNMLDDEQNITLVVQFVSTGFTCEHFTLQHNTEDNQNVFSDQFICRLDKENGILSVSTLLMQSIPTLQFNLKGPYFIGGLRLCFTGRAITTENGKHSVEALNACHFYHTPDETLTVSPVVNIEMIKTINRTEALASNGEMKFSGRWLPILTMRRLVDTSLYRQRGENYRYLSSQITLIVQMVQSKFYIRNTQEPIARKSEITFSTLLFATLCLELLGLLFLIFKLAVMPVIRLIQRRIDRQHSKPPSS